MSRVAVARWAGYAGSVWFALYMAGMPAPSAAVDCTSPSSDDAAQRFCVPRASESTRDTSAERLIPPLSHLQVIFGYFDRRFPNFNGWQEHAGVDFAASAGSPVFAICEGNVALTRTERPEIMQAFMAVAHQCPEPLGRVYGYYGHIHSNLVEGDVVSAGSVLGTVRDWQGNTHLHFGLSRRLTEENWGVHPRGATLQGLQDLGWLDPLQHFDAVVPAPPMMQRAAPKPLVKRPIRPAIVRGKPRR